MSPKKLSKIVRSHRSLYVIATLLLMESIYSWQNSITFLGLHLSVQHKLCNFRKLPKNKDDTKNDDAPKREIVYPTLF